MTEKGMVDLQNCMDLLKVKSHSYNSLTCLVSFHDGNQLIHMNIEVTDIQKEGDSLLITFPVIKLEHKVICIRLCVPSEAHFTDKQDCEFLLCLCLSIHMK
jgi:hypothetical protein